jgi:hypothetical protein
MVTLSSRGIPGEITTLEQFLARVHCFDFYTDMSDDNRVYLGGRRNREAVEAFAADNELAADIWKDACKAQALSFMASQLIGRVADFVLCEADGIRDPEVFWSNHKELSEFCINYLAGATAGHNLLTDTMRDRIGDLIKNCPPSWKDKERRNELIDQWIKDFDYAKAS